MPRIVALLLFCIGLGAVERPAVHFIGDPVFRQQVQERFESRRRLAARREVELFSVLRRPLPTVEAEALRFLFAYMPLSDLADGDGEYFLEQVRFALRARRELPWGGRVPEELFRQFVLPCRVNTESLDRFRPLLYEELRRRVQGMGMAEAALEINHWCHEHVVYRGTDIRTSAPLDTMRAAFGRCGEESVLAVCALRTVGIPARQVYVPRWSHCDDNHAWVEVWIDGRWRFLGACEPEPELDVAWFNAPARRAMLVDTLAFGHAGVGAGVIAGNACGARLNEVERYAAARTLNVRVTDAAGRPAAGAAVFFTIYNYSEFFPAARRPADPAGVTSLRTGRGDMLVWAVKDGRFGLALADAAAESVTVVLEHDGGREFTLPFSVTPPPELPAVLPPISPAARERNKERLAAEDALRQRYIDTFIDRTAAGRLARGLGLEEAALWDKLQRSRGNWREIAAFLRSLPPERRAWGMGLLEVISEKDLRDAPAAVLLSHWRAFAGRGRPAREVDPLRLRYVLNPRLAHEKLGAWRPLLAREMTGMADAGAAATVVRLARWTAANIRLLNEENPYGVPLTPTGVWRLRAADTLSRAVFFAAACRSLGIPARLDPQDQAPQFWDDGAWRGVDLQEGVLAPAARRTAGLELTWDEAVPGLHPQYSTHFSLSRLENGACRLLDYEQELAAPTFPCRIELAPAAYVLISGFRRPDGRIDGEMRLLLLAAGETRRVPLTVRPPEPPRPLGTLAAGETIRPLRGEAVPLSSLCTGRGAMVVALGDDEPSRHVLQELRAAAARFDAWGGKIVLLLDERRATEWKGDGLPAAVIPALADPGLPARLWRAGGRAGAPTLPLFCAVNGAGGIVYLEEGYRIGAPEQMRQLLAAPEGGTK